MPKSFEQDVQKFQRGAARALRFLAQLAAFISALAGAADAFRLDDDDPKAK